MHHLNRVSIVPRLTHALPPDEATATIGPEGGIIALAHAGLTLEFPDGAVASPVTLTVQAHPSLVGFTVTPEVELLKPVSVRQELDPQHPGDTEGFAFAHVDDVAAHTPGTAATANELIRATVKRGLGVRRFVVALLKHFSGYLLASGINAGQACDPEVVTDGTCIWVDDGDGQPEPQ